MSLLKSHPCPHSPSLTPALSLNPSLLNPTRLLLPLILLLRPPTLFLMLRPLGKRHGSDELPGILEHLEPGPWTICMCQLNVG